jgi:hypothetical protein
MSRMNSSSNDPTSRNALAFEGVELLHAILDTLSEREAAVMALRFGLTDGLPRTYEQIGQILGVSPKRIDQVVKAIMVKLHHPSRIQVLGVFEEGQLVDVVSTLALGVIDYTYPAEYRTYCSHCHQVPLINPVGDENLKGGRIRKYCSNACRQAAYRARKS